MARKNSEPLGKRFEERFLAEVRNQLGDDIQITVNSYKDQCQGTDFVAWGVPCDITLRIAEKDHTEIFSDTLAVSSELLHINSTIRFGVRLGNNHHGYTEFDTPVLVVGLNVEQWELQYEFEGHLGLMVSHIREILDTGLDQYWDWMDAHATVGV